MSKYIKAVCAPNTAIDATSKDYKSDHSICGQIGIGTNVDWSLENKLFSKTLTKYHVEPFKIEMINDYLAEVSIDRSIKKTIVRKFANDLFASLKLIDREDGIDFHQYNQNCFLDVNDSSYYVVFNHHDVARCNEDSNMYKYTVEAVWAAGDGGDEEEVTWEQVLTLASGILEHRGFKAIFEPVPNNEYAYRGLVWWGRGKSASAKCLLAVEEMLKAICLLPPDRNLSKQMVGDYYLVVKVDGAFAIEFNHPELICVGPDDDKYKYTVGSYA